jgi:head-tail adaptor
LGKNGVPVTRRCQPCREAKRYSIEKEEIVAGEERLRSRFRVWSSNRSGVTREERCRFESEVI